MNRLFPEERSCFISGFIAFLALLFCSESVIPAEDEQVLVRLNKIQLKAEENATAVLARYEKLSSPLTERQLSERGDALFFLGRFQEAADDYNAMCELHKRLENSHWRRGIAWFYAGDFKKAAHQFEIYHTFDNVDRENGIWRFFSQTKAYGLKKAREELLRYEKDDREPFPHLYQLFAGKKTAEEILTQINQAKVEESEKQKRYFYAHLYIGLNAALLEDHQTARTHLTLSTLNSWPEKAGYGPHYMWQVGRLALKRLDSKKQDESPNVSDSQ